MKTAKIGVSGILWSKRDGVLLGKRRADDESLPGLWCTPGGGVEDGESLATALCREFFEEVRLQIAIGRLISVQERTSERGNSLLVFYQVHLIRPQSPACGDEFELIRGATLAEIMDRKEEITPMTYAALNDFFDARTGYAVDWR